MGRPATMREYICTRCGYKTRWSINMGRPHPRVCPRSKTKGPHRWVKNRDL